MRSVLRVVACAWVAGMCMVENQLQDPVNANLDGTTLHMRRYERTEHNVYPVMCRLHEP